MLREAGIYSEIRTLPTYLWLVGVRGGNKALLKGENGTF